jgi:hypothetical protein
MGHSIGISDSYYKITEQELLTEYLNAVTFLTLSEIKQIQNQSDEILSRNQNDNILIDSKLLEKELEIEDMKQQIKSLLESQREIFELLKNPGKLMQIE